MKKTSGKKNLDSRTVSAAVWRDDHTYSNIGRVVARAKLLRGQGQYNLRG
jgi:hypothetical protein